MWQPMQPNSSLKKCKTKISIAANEKKIHCIYRGFIIFIIVIVHCSGYLTLWPLTSDLHKRGHYNHVVRWTLMRNHCLKYFWWTVPDTLYRHQSPCVHNLIKKTDMWYIIIYIYNFFYLSGVDLYALIYLKGHGLLSCTYQLLSVWNVSHFLLLVVLPVFTLYIFFFQLSLFHCWFTFIFNFHFPSSF